MRRIALTLLISLAAAFAAVADMSPKYELRGAWLATAYGIDWPSKAGADMATAKRQRAELDTMLTRLSRAGINAVFFQARPMADALYSSSVEPWSAFLTGSRGMKSSFDPLEFCVERCHELGMECHAWINPFRVGRTKPSTPLDRSRSHLWMTNSVKRSTMTIFNPALEETRRHLCDVVEEIATDYDIDGIVFDDYFYNPEFMPEDKRAADYDLYMRSSDGLKYDDWRRRNINLAIADVAALLATIKDGRLRFGVSPQGIGGGNGAHSADGVPDLTSYGVKTADSQYAKIYSDPVSWLKEGLIDYVSPQIYWPTTNASHPYGGLCKWWNDVAALFGRHCFASQTIAPFMADNSPEAWRESLLEIDLNRSLASDGAPGSVFYSASYISGPKRSGFGKLLRDSVFSSPALVPPMKWKPGSKALKVKSLKLKGDELKWRGDDNCRYVVYAIPASVDPLDALSTDSNGFQSRYIIGITYVDRFILPSTYRDGYRIAVVPYDRYGNEWDPTFLKN